MIQLIDHFNKGISIEQSATKVTALLWTYPYRTNQDLTVNHDDYYATHVRLTEDELAQFIGEANKALRAIRRANKLRKTA